MKEITNNFLLSFKKTFDFLDVNNDAIDMMNDGIRFYLNNTVNN